MSEHEDGRELSGAEAAQAVTAALRSVGWKCTNEECGALNAPAAPRCETCGAAPAIGGGSISDTDLIDFLEKANGERRYTGRCSFRWSSTGRGWRLHEGESGYGSVREAIAAAMRAASRPAAPKAEAADRIELEPFDPDLKGDIARFFQSVDPIYFRHSSSLMARMKALLERATAVLEKGVGELERRYAVADRTIETVEKQRIEIDRLRAAVDGHKATEPGIGNLVDQAIVDRLNLSGVPKDNALRVMGLEIERLSDLLVDALHAEGEWERRMMALVGEDGIESVSVEVNWLKSRVRELEGRLAADSEYYGFNLLAHLRRQRAFSEKTFGPGARTKGVLDHIRKELAEIEAEPVKLSEWIDVVILALDGAWRAGHSPEAIVAALVAKQETNESRAWPDWRTADPNKAIEHVRAEECGRERPANDAGGRRCEECRHEFSAADLAAEPPNEWGHPCHAHDRASHCESYRVPMGSGAARGDVPGQLEMFRNRPDLVERFNALTIGEFPANGDLAHGVRYSILIGADVDQAERAVSEQLIRAAASVPVVQTGHFHEGGVLEGLAEELETKRAAVAGALPGAARKALAPDARVFDWASLSSTGLLWLINRAALHPRGLSLCLVEESAAEPPYLIGWTLEGNGTELFAFDAPADDLGFGKLSAFLAERRAGSALRAEPVPPAAEPDVTTFVEPEAGHAASEPVSAARTDEGANQP